MHATLTRTQAGLLWRVSSGQQHTHDYQLATFLANQMPFPYHRTFPYSSYWMQVKHLDYLIKFLIRIFFSRAYYFNSINRIWGITKVQYPDKGIHRYRENNSEFLFWNDEACWQLHFAPIIATCLPLLHYLRLKLKPAVSHCELDKSVYNKCLYVHR